MICTLGNRAVAFPGRGAGYIFYDGVVVSEIYSALFLLSFFQFKVRSVFLNSNLQSHASHVIPYKGTAMSNLII